MDVILIFNGLGNQMSQYAFYLRKNSEKPAAYLFLKKSRAIHNGYELERVFGIPYFVRFRNNILYFIFQIASYKKYPVISRPIVGLLKLLGVEVIYENDDYNFKPQYIRPSKGIKFFVGGWHSEKYFIDIQEKVLESFQFKPEQIDHENRLIVENIKNCNSVSVHVRRGDFLDKNNYGKLGGVCTQEYFVKAIEKMRTLVENPQFFFFTNDISWVRENFKHQDYQFVDINKKENSWKDMYLISNCAHHINSNGSFSWWSAWLNKSDNPYVIVPKNFTVGRYFEDIYPENWIKLSDY